MERELFNDLGKIEGALSWWLSEMEQELEDQLLDWDYWWGNSTDEEEEETK